MAKKHSVLTNDDLHNPRGILVHSTGSMLVMSQSMSTATASFHFIPNTTDTYTLGNAARAWKELFVSTSSIKFADKGGNVIQTIKASSEGVSFISSSGEVADISGSTISGSKLHIVGDTFIGGDLTLGDADTDSISITADLTSNLTPNADATYDLGSSSQGWNDLHLGSGGVINLDGGDVTLTHAAGKVTLGGDGAVEFDFANHEMTNVDIDGGAIDGTIIGAASAAAGTFAALVGTSLSVSDGNITNVGDIALDTISADDGSSLSFSNNWTNAGRTVADLGVVTTVDINGGTIDGATIGAASHTTIKGTTIDATTDFTVDGLVLTADTITNDAVLTVVSTGLTLNASLDIALSADGGNVTMDDGTTTAFDFNVDDVELKIHDDAQVANYASIAVGDNGATTFTTVDADAAAANLLFTVDGTAEIASQGLITLDSGAAINIEPAAGSAILLDGTISIDAGVVTGATSITSTAFLGTIDGVVGGNTPAAITGTTIDATTDFTIGSTVITDDSIVMTPTSGDTATIAASTNGALTITTVDTAAAAANLLFTIDGTAEIASAGLITLDSGGAINLEPAGGSAILLDGTISIDAGVVTGATSITSTDLIGTNIDGIIGADTARAGTFTNLTVTTDVNIDDSSGDGAIDGVIIGAATAASATFTTLNTTGTTVLGNGTGDDISITGRIAADIDPKTDNTYDLGASGLEWKDIHIDGVAYIDTLNADALGANLDHANFNSTNVDIDSGAIDGTVIGATTPASASFSGVIVTGGMDVQGNLTTISSTNLDIGDRIVTLNASSAAGDGGLYINDADTTETGSLLWDVSADRWIGGLKDAEVTLVTISSTDTLTNKTLTSPDINGGTWNGTVDGNSTAAGITWADLGSVTTCDINGGTIDNTVIGASTQAAGDFSAIGAVAAGTIVGTTIDATTDFTIGSTVITDDSIVMTPSTSDTITFSGATNGVLAITTVDNAAAAANITITADGTFEAIGTTVTLDSGGAINLEPAAGSAILLDGTISVDAGVVTGATSITSTALVGELTGNASTATALATARTIAMTGDVAWTSPSFDGSGNVTAAGTIQANAVQTGMVHDDVATELAGTGMTATSGVLNVIGGTGITANANEITTTDGDIVHDSLSGFVANEHIDHTGVTLTAGDGLTGGGTIAASRTFTVAGGDGITANANDVAVTAAQTTITSVLNTGLKVGYDNNDCFNFATGSDGQISVYQNMIEEFRFTAGGTFHADADIVAYSSTVASDMNLKENITDTKYGLSDIMKLRGVDFDWKRKDMGHSVGVLAQEVEAIIPEIVKEHEGLHGREKFKSVDYNKLVPILIESIKELKKEIDDLKSN